MTRNFLDISKECAVFLRSLLTDREQLRDAAKDSRFRDWKKAAYEEPGFLFDGDYLFCYQECEGKEIRFLTEEQARGCITFLLRQMRFQYEPYPCLENGELLFLLERWIDLKEGANG